MDPIFFDDDNLDLFPQLNFNYTTEVDTIGNESESSMKPQDNLHPATKDEEISISNSSASSTEKPNDDASDSCIEYKGSPLKVEDRNSFPCPDPNCNKSYPKKSSVSRHVRYAHPDFKRGRDIQNKPFSCNFCSTLFINQASKDRHTRRFHVKEIKTRRKIACL